MTIESLDQEDQQLLAGLTPEGALPGSDPTFVPTEEGEGDPAAAAPAPAPAAAPAAPAPSPVAPAPAAAAPAAAPAAAAPAAPAPAPAEGGDPRAALRASRAAEKRLRDELRRKDEELEALRAKTGTQTDDTAPEDYSEEQLADLKENYPLQYRMVMDLRDLKARVPAPGPAPAPATEWQAPEFEPVVQEVIDQVPQLQAWQYSQADQGKFDMAADFDASLRLHPDWKGKPAVERFQEAVRLTAQRFGAAPAPAPRPDPAAILAAAPVTSGPAGLSDFRGGGPAAAPSLDFRGMSDEQILASLKPEY